MGTFCVIYLVVLIKHILITTISKFLCSLYLSFSIEKAVVFGKEGPVLCLVACGTPLYLVFILCLLSSPLFCLFSSHNCFYCCLVFACLIASVSAISFSCTLFFQIHAFVFHVFIYLTHVMGYVYYLQY